MKKFLNLKSGEKFASVASSSQNAWGDKELAIELEKSPEVVTEAPALPIPVNHARRGSIRTFIREDGTPEIRVRPYQARTSRRGVGERLHSTPHGEITRNSQKIRIVLEFPVTYSHDALSAAVDDECYSVIQYISNIYKAPADDSSDC